uniref:Apolipoprotein A-II n=1 Tax=Sphaeramia orbicularis TaxID=375764 RepID=A0A672YEM9_9TELE
MNAKYAIALILTLQVSLSLCDIPAPSPELVEKYDNYKRVFYQRLQNAYNNLMERVEQAKQNEHGQAVMSYVDSAKANPRVGAAIELIKGAHEELQPAIDEARTKVLGAYEHYLRPQVGQFLNDAIENIRTYLNVYMPAN